MKQKAPLQQPSQTNSEQTRTTGDNESTFKESADNVSAYKESSYNEPAHNKPAFNKPAYSGPSIMGRSPEEMVQMMGADAFIHMTTAPDVYEGWRKERGLDKDPVYRQRHEMRMRMLHPQQEDDTETEEQEISKQDEEETDTIHEQEEAEDESENADLQENKGEETEEIEPFSDTAAETGTAPLLRESEEEELNEEEEQEETADLLRADDTDDNDEIQESSLRVSDPADRSEIEAEQMSSRVMTMPEPAVPPASTANAETAHQGSIHTNTPVARQEEDGPEQDEADEHEEARLLSRDSGDDEDDNDVQTALRQTEFTVPTRVSTPLNERSVLYPATNETFSPQCTDQAEIPERSRRIDCAQQDPDRHHAAVSPEITSRINRQRGSGASLPESTQNFMESRMDADFRDVNIHNNSESHDLSKSLNAKAFTVGNDVFFGAGHYSPETHSGKKLIAHELTHVVQKEGAQKKEINRAPEPASKGETIKYISTLWQNDMFMIEVTHNQNYGELFAHIHYTGTDYCNNQTTMRIFFGKSDILKQPFSNFKLSDKSNKNRLSSASRNELVFEYKNDPKINFTLLNIISLNENWTPARRIHTFLNKSEEGKGSLNLYTGTYMNSESIEVIPKNAIPTELAGSIGKIKLVDPPREEFTAEQAILLANLTIDTILENKETYHFSQEKWKPVKQHLNSNLGFLQRLSQQNIQTSTNDGLARWAGRITRTISFSKSRVQNIGHLNYKELYPQSIAEEAYHAVNNTITLYEDSCISSYTSLDTTNELLQKAEQEYIALPYQLSHLFLKKGDNKYNDGGLDAIKEDINSLSRQYMDYKSKTPIGTMFGRLEKVLGTGKYESILMGPRGRYGAASQPKNPRVSKNLNEYIRVLREQEKQANPDIFVNVIQLLSSARRVKSLFTMLALHEMFQLFKANMEDLGSQFLDAILPGSGNEKVDKHIGQIGSLLRNVENRIKSGEGLSEEFLIDITTQFNSIVGNKNFKEDLDFITKRLQTIAKTKAVVKALVVIVIAAIGAGLIGPAIGAAAGKMALGFGMSQAAAGLVGSAAAFGGEVLSFTVLSRIGNQIAFGGNETGFLEDLGHNFIMFGVLKGISKIHGAVFAKFADPKLHVGLFKATQLASTLISLHGLAMVQHAIKNKGEMMTAEDHMWTVIQNLALVAALSLGHKLINKAMSDRLSDSTKRQLTTQEKIILEKLDAQRGNLKIEMETIREMGVRSESVKRRITIRNIEKQFNSDMAFIEMIESRIQTKKGIASMRAIRAEYRTAIESIQIQMVEYGFQFNAGGKALTRLVAPNVISYQSDAFKDLKVDPITNQPRTVIDLGNGMFEIISGKNRYLYIPEKALPVNIADPKGIRAIVEFYKYDWNSVKAEFGSDGSTAANYLLEQAWKQGWRPGQPVPNEISVELSRYYQGRLNRLRDSLSTDAKAELDLISKGKSSQETLELLQKQGDAKKFLEGRANSKKMAAAKGDDFKNIINKVKDRILKAGDQFDLKYTDGEIKDIFNKGEKLGLDNKTIEDLIFTGSRNKKRLSANELITQMDTHVNIIKKRGYPFLFKDLETFKAFSTDLKKLLVQYNIPIKDIRIQGSSLRTANANDIDLAVFVSKNDFDNLVEGMIKGIRSRVEKPATARKMIKELKIQVEKGRISSYYFDRIGSSSFNDDLYILSKYMSGSDDIDLSLILKDKNFDVSPYMEVK